MAIVRAACPRGLLKTTMAEPNAIDKSVPAGVRESGVAGQPAVSPSGPADKNAEGDYVDIHDKNQCGYWCARWGCGDLDLRVAVNQVGRSVWAVESWLRRNGRSRLAKTRN